MPAYDYRCTVCDEVFEVTRSISDEDAVPCPSCAAETRRLFSPVGVLFKGSGFHNTDYRKKDAGSAEESAPAAAPCGAAKSDGGACATCPAATQE
jgi:putative FmdB family regulatory protein